MKFAIIALFALLTNSVPAAPPDIVPPVEEKAAAEPVKSLVRINRIVVFSEHGTAGIVVMRERQQIDASGAVVGGDHLPMIRRDLPAAATETIVAPDGRKVALAEVLGYLGQFAAKWSAEDAPAKH